MLNADPDALIGVDGGGTSCRIALLWQGARFGAQTGAANAFTDLDAAIATVTAGLEQVAAAAGLTLADLAHVPAHLGLAGVITPAIARNVAAGLALRRASVGDDRATAIAGALGESDGTVASVGTGSFLGRQVDGQATLIGGYGFRLGDEASGAWLGRALLSRLLHVADGIAAPSALTETTFAGFGRDVAQVVGFASGAMPRDFGRFAPDIAAAANDNDETGIWLMRQGAQYLTNGLAALGWRAGEPLVLLGGVASRYTPFLPAEITTSITAPRGSALDGALTLAARNAGPAA